MSGRSFALTLIKIARFHFSQVTGKIGTDARTISRKRAPGTRHTRHCPARCGNPRSICAGCGSTAWGGFRKCCEKRELTGVLLYDPINVRYANGSSNMQVWILHNQHRYCWVPLRGQDRTVRLSAGGASLGTPRDDRRDTSGPDVDIFRCGRQLPGEGRPVGRRNSPMVIRETTGGSLEIAADHLDPLGARALEERGCTIANGQEIMERARSIKSGGRNTGDAHLHFGMRGGHGEDVRETSRRNHRKPALVPSPSGQYCHGRRMDRDPAPGVRR